MVDPKIFLAFRQIEVIKALSPHSQDILATFSAIRPIRKGETLFCEGEPSPYCFGLLTGEVILTSTTGGSQPITYRSGMLLGGLSLLREMPRPGLGAVRESGQLLSVWSSRFRAWVDTQRSVEGDPPILSELRHLLM